MDKYPVLAGGETVGELTVEAATSDTVLDMSCVRREGLWCAWAVGESGALRIGIPEPEGDRLHLRRRFSRSMTAPIGRILRGELRMPEGNAAMAAGRPGSTSGTKRAFSAGDSSAAGSFDLPRGRTAAAGLSQSGRCAVPAGGAVLLCVLSADQGQRLLDFCL